VKRLVTSCGALALCLLLQAQTNDWDRIDILCVVRDAQGHPVTNLTKDRLEILDAGEARPILKFSRPTDRPQIERVANGPNLYQDAYLAIMRTFRESSQRRILVIEDQPPHRSPSTVTAARRWELIFLAERRGVVVYVLGGDGGTLTDMALETGGRAVASERDIQGDLAVEYHIVGQPSPHATGTGTFHTLEVRAGSTLRVQAPRSYYIAPPWKD
jgi:hypothetical protein